MGRGRNRVSGLEIGSRDGRSDACVLVGDGGFKGEARAPVGDRVLGYVKHFRGGDVDESPAFAALALIHR